MKRNEPLQRLCRQYLKRLQYMADKHGLGFWVRDMIRENKRGECEATKNEVRMLERMVDEERVERKDIPSIVGKSYRQCVDENVFDKIDTLKRQGIYSRLSALLMAYKNKENK
jgi:hypothetical protein